MHNKNSVFGFIWLLVSRPRTLLAVFTLVLWLSATLAMIVVKPDVNTHQGRPDFYSLAFWKDGWWRYSGNSDFDFIPIHATPRGFMPLLVSQGMTLRLSFDQGDTWAVAPLSEGISSWLLNQATFVDQMHGWIVGYEGVLLATEDGGHSWNRQDSKVKVSLSSIAFAPDGRHGWAIGDVGTIITTADAGNLWTRQDITTLYSIGEGVPDLSSVDLIDEKQAWILTFESVLTTTDGGLNWTRKKFAGAVLSRSIDFVSSTQGWIVGVEGEIFATQNGGNDWSKQESKSLYILNSVVFADNQHGWAVGDKGTIVATSDGQTWKLQTSHTSARLHSVGFKDQKNAWALGDNGIILTTTDGGEHWQKRNLLSSDMPEWYFIFSLLALPVFLFGLSGMRLPQPSDSITAMLSSDRPQKGAEPDALGAKPLAWALSRFLRHKRTEPPLTIALNAPWGGGKSSLMNWLREDLERFGFRPVWFNAWHYEKQEQMFPALMEIVRRKAIPPLLTWAGLKFRGRLLQQRIHEQKVPLAVLAIVLLFPLGWLFWSSVLSQRFDTPRRLKRFLNHLLFNAMRIRTLDRPDRTLWETVWHKIRGAVDETEREKRLSGEESKLLLMSVMEACCGDALDAKRMLLGKDKRLLGIENPKVPFQQGWEEKIIIDRQLESERGSEWASELRKVLIEYLHRFAKNAMPQPLFADLQRFEALMPARITPKSSRLPGSLEIEGVRDPAQPERRRAKRRSGKTDYCQFVNDRRAGIDRRKSSEAETLAVS